MPVFYNAGMSVDRDLEVAVGRALDPGGSRRLGVWEMTAATGVRGLRLLHESGAVGELLSTESHPLAFEVLERNSARYSSEGARARRHDAREPVPDGPRFDWVDLDPYGSPAPFLASALSMLEEGGLLSVTATDLRVLAGVERGAAERRYGGRPIRGRLGPEGGLRLLLAWVDRALHPRGFRARPLLSYVRDHHIRAYVRVQPAGGTASPVDLVETETWTGPALPAPGPYGPLWLGPLFDPALVGRLQVPPTAAEPERLARFVGRLQEETVADRPFFYESNSLAESLRLAQPPSVARLIEALRNEGEVAARSHVREGAFRTTAPRAKVEALARRVSPG